jgi:dihydrofolate reductase
MRISLIVAMAADRVIGRDGALPWRLPADLRRFKRLTMGHALIVGRKTWESIGRPLPGRTMIVVTRQPDYQAVNQAVDQAEGVQVVHSVDEALRIAREVSPDEAFVAGGAEIYRATLPVADRLHLTRIEQDFPGDTRFPDYDESLWELVDEERHEPAGDLDDSPFAYAFQVFDRKHQDDEDGKTF